MEDESNNVNNGEIKVYELNGTVLDEFQVTALYRDVFEQFGLDHPDFSGAKIIYAPLRRVDSSAMARYISLASELKVRSSTKINHQRSVGTEGPNK